MLKIRLMRIGGRQRPFYRVVAVDERNKRSGGYVELLGTYNPLTEPKEIKLKQDRIDHWVKQGAQMSTGFLRIIGKAPQRPPRKPKKERQQVTVDSGQVKTKEPKAEEPKSEEVKSEEVQEAPAETTEPVAEETTSVIPSESEESSISNEQIATASPVGGPRNDKEKKENKKDERPA